MDIVDRFLAYVRKGGQSDMRQWFTMQKTYRFGPPDRWFKK